jgi:septal ring factor EnvC (AmiA/AmiB activator)
VYKAKISAMQSELAALSAKHEASWAELIQSQHDLKSQAQDCKTMTQILEDCEGQLAKYKMQETLLEQRERAVAEKAITKPVVHWNTAIVSENLSNAEV